MTVVCPNKTLVCPGETLVCPDETLVFSDETQICPGETLVCPDKTLVCPDETWYVRTRLWYVLLWRDPGMFLRVSCRDDMACPDAAVVCPGRAGVGGFRLTTFQPEATGCAGGFHGDRSTAAGISSSSSVGDGNRASELAERCIE